MADSTTSMSAKLSIHSPMFDQPAGILDYLLQTDSDLLLCSARFVSDVLQLPPANASNTDTKIADDTKVDTAYKKLADPDPTYEQAGEGKKEQNKKCDEMQIKDRMNVNILTLIKQSCRQHTSWACTFVLGQINAFDFVRYSTFKAYLLAKFGGTTKVASAVLDLAVAKLVSDPNHIDEYLNINLQEKCSDGSQCGSLFAKIYTARAEVKRLSNTVITTPQIWTLIKHRLHTMRNVADNGPRYPDAEWAKIDAQKDNLAMLEKTISALDEVRSTGSSTTATTVTEATENARTGLARLRFHTDLRLQSQSRIVHTETTADSSNQELVFTNTVQRLD